MTSSSPTGATELLEMTKGMAEMNEKIDMMSAALEKLCKREAQINPAVPSAPSAEADENESKEQHRFEDESDGDEDDDFDGAAFEMVYDMVKDSWPKKKTWGRKELAAAVGHENAMEAINEHCRIGLLTRMGDKVCFTVPP